MSSAKVVVGIYSYIDDLTKAVSKVKHESLPYKVYSPVPNHEIEDLTLPEKSPVRFVTGFGALCGLIGGFSLAILCSMDYPMRVSAKDIISIPGFVVIGYECTILFGGIFTLLALLHFCRIPDLFRKPGYDPRFSDDKFGVVVNCDSGSVEKIKACLSEAGAEEVRVEEAL